MAGVATLLPARIAVDTGQAPMCLRIARAARRVPAEPLRGGRHRQLCPRGAPHGAPGGASYKMRPFIGGLSRVSGMHLRMPALVPRQVRGRKGAAVPVGKILSRVPEIRQLA